MTHPSDRTTVYADGAPSVAETLTHVEVAERLAPGTLVAGRYRIGAFRGFGGMGIVYKAHDEELGVDVALKVLRSDLRRDPRWVQRFRREIVLAREITHRNVVRIHDIGESGPLRFLTMDFIDGPSLGEVLAREGPLPVKRAVAIVRQLAEALQEAHAAGIVHRDLKPTNILLGPDDTAYITDFGVARSRAGEALTHAGAIVGTPEYLSPEQASGQPVDGRSDLYALGIVFFEILTGKLPFRGETPSERLAQRLAGEAPDVSSGGVRVPAGVRRVVRRCLTRAPRRRYQEAHEIVADLDTVDQAPGGWRLDLRWGPRRSTPARLPRPSTSSGRPEPVEGRWGPRGWAMAACAVLLVAALVWWAAAMRRGGSASGPPSAVAIEHAVAVLPLADETRDPDLAWVATGGAELLASSLAASPDLRVVGRDRLRAALSGLQLPPGRYSDRAIGGVGRLLGVDRVITGRVRRTGQRARLDLQLASVAGAQDVTRVPLLSAEAGNAVDFFHLMNDLGWRLRQALDGDTPPDGEAPSLRTRAPAAAVAYIEGQARLHENDPEAAASLFQRALDIDARFAEALEGLSQAYQDLGDLDAAVDAAERAGALVGKDDHRLADRVRARRAMLRQEPNDALPLYGRLAARYPNDASTLIDLASAQAQASRSADAMQTLRRVIGIDPTNARAWLLLGESALRSGTPHAAVDRYLVRARRLYERLNDQRGMASVVEAMGKADCRTGRYEQALAHLTDAISRRERLGDQRALAATFRQRAGARLASGDRRLAAADIASARQIVQRRADRASLADFIDATGAMYDAHGTHGLAQQAYQEALLMRRALGDTTRLAQSYDRVGDAAFAQGDYAGAPIYWNEALTLRQRAGDKRGVIASTQDLGSLALVQGRWSDAESTFRTTLQRSGATSFQRGMAVSHEQLARLQRYRGRHGEALASLQQALGIARQLAEPALLIDCTLDEAGLLIEMGQLDRARARLGEAERSIQRAHNRDQQVRHRLLGALLHEQEGHHAAAARALAAVGDLAASGDNHALSLTVRLAQARIRSEHGDARARAALAKLAAEADSLGNVVLRLEAGAAMAGDEVE